ncbi:MAG TPA: 2-succinyl-5-enolpyruvyl-6-hydroxy-3-cyclohexene-1-carboxylic-acid synthase [Acidimicrobiales bacterium]|nr:2-succinyl-5-enolpyruvyl-6-hydroxy-3-cyclohexene-1-carboxylic-acid synthase [Acidimicrobiales bacterium]
MTTAASRPATQATFAATLVDEWARAGVTEAVVAPGSRSAPLALALVADGRFRVRVVLDERSAGFIALGIGTASGRPAVVVTTSGTAAAELHPAVLEAHHGGVPMLVCTGDRPPELHHVGAPQTIEQTRLFDGVVRWSAEPGVARPEAAPTWRSLAARAAAETTGGPGGPGPVHLNLAFVEPLTGGPGELPPGRDGGSPWHAVSRVAAAPGDDIVSELARPGGRGLIVAGAGAGDGEAVARLARALRWPVLADLRSGCRLPGEMTVGAADGILRCQAFAGASRPGIVLHLGGRWASKVLGGWLAADPGTRHVVVDPFGRWGDPDRAATVMVAADATELCWIVAEAATEERVDPAWWTSWRDAESAAQSAIDGVLARRDDATEPGLARDLVDGLPADATLFVSSSMPVRDTEWFGRPRPGLRVLANRGTNGIDGVVSTVIGVAAAGATGGPTVALLGDLAFLHDAGALAVGAGAVDATLVVVDNAGGGIFSFLPQAADVGSSDFELLFGTPPVVDVASVAAGYGIGVTTVTRAAALWPAVYEAIAAGGIRVVRVTVPDRAANVALHDEIHAAVADAVEATVA